MPKQKFGAKVKKLKEGDTGFDPKEDSFVVEDAPHTRVMTLSRVNARIEQLKKNKAIAIDTWDSRIASFTALKAKIEAAPKPAPKLEAKPATKPRATTVSTTKPEKATTVSKPEAKTKRRRRRRRRRRSRRSRRGPWRRLR
jgi:hypothetical protein